MAVNITDGSLFWVAGIDTDNFDRDSDKIKSELEGLTQTAITEAAKQNAAFQEAFKLPTNGIKQSSKAFSDAVASNITAIRAQLADLEAQSITLNGRVDTEPILSAIRLLHQQLDAIDAESIDIETGINTSGISSGVAFIKEQIAKLSTDTLRVNVDESELDTLRQHLAVLQSKSIELSAKSLDVSEITSGIDSINQRINDLNAKSIQVEAKRVNIGPLTSELINLQSQIEKVSGERIDLQIGKIDTASLQNAFAELQSRMERLNNTQLNLKVAGIDTTSLTESIQRAQAQFEKLKGLTLNGVATLDATQFKTEYDKLQQNLVELEGEKVRLRVAGIDTAELEKSITDVRARAASLSRDVLKINVDEEGLKRLEARLQSLDLQKLQAKGIDVTPITDELQKVQSKINDIRSQAIEVRTGRTNLAPLNNDLLSIKNKIEALSGEKVQIQVGDTNVTALERIQRIMTGIQERTTSLNETAATAFKQQQTAVDALGKSYNQSEKELQEYLAVVDQYNREGVNVPVNQRAQLVTDTPKPQAQTYSAGVDIDESVMRRSQQTLASLDEETRLYVENLVKLEKQIVEVETAQRALSAQYAKGDISDKQFNQASVALLAEEKRLTDSLDDLVRAQAAYDKQLADVGFINQRKAALASMRLELSQLTEAELKDPNIGGQLKKNIADVKKEIVDLNKVSSNAKSGLLEGLNNQLKTLKEQLAKADTAPLIASLNKQIDQTKSKIQQLSQAGRIGFDAFGKPLREQEGILQKLQRQIAIYKRGVQEANSPESLTKYNAKLDETIRKYKQLQNAGKLGFDINGNPVKNLDNVGKSAEKTAAKTGLLAKSFGILRRAADYIPGLGLAGLFGLISEAVFGLISQIDLFGRKSLEAKTKSDLLADAQKNVANNMASVEAKVRPYVEALDRANVSEGDRLIIYNKLRAIDPQIVAGLDAKTISYERLKNNVDAYLDSLRRQYRLEVNEDATKGSIVEEEKLIKLYDRKKAALDDLYETQKTGKDRSGRELPSAARTSLQENIAFEEKELASLRRQVKAQQAVTSSLGSDRIKLDGETEKTARRTLAVIDQEISAQKKLQSETSANSKEYQSYQDAIGKLEEERKRITGASAKEIKAVHVLENKTNDILEKRKAILDKIREAKSDADNGTLLKEQTEIEKISDKYAGLIRKVEEYNNKANRFNKQTKGSGVPTIGQSDINTLIQAERTEIENARQKQEAETFKQSIEARKKIFTDYENFKLQVGRDNADRIFQKETEGLSSYIDLLNKELAKLSIDNSNGGKIKRSFLTDELVNAQIEQRQRQISEQQKTFADLLTLTASYETKRLAIDEKYGKMRQALNSQVSSISSEEYERQNAELTKAKEDEYRILDAAVTRQTDLYRRIGKETINLTRAQIRSEIEFLENELKNNKNLTPQMQVDVQGAIDKLKGLITASDEATGNLEKLIRGGTQLGSAFSSLASDVEGINAELAEALRFVGSLISGLTSAASSLKAFNKAKADDDVAGQISSGLGIVGAAVGVVGGIVGLFSKAAEERKRRAAEVKEMQSQIFSGEIAVNALYRERELIQARTNKLRLDGIKAETAALIKQRDQVNQDIANVFAELQKQRFNQVTTVTNPMTGVSQQLIGSFSLMGKTFEEIEKLFLQGQLDTKAQDLFSTLQKLKSEGLDIDRALEDAKKRAQEIFTGTTAESLAKSIRDGLKNGYKSVADFAANMTEVFQEAILSGFEAKVIEERMKEFYDSFADAAQSNGGLDAAEITALKALYEGKLQDILNQFNQLQSVTGQSFATTNSANTMQGAIKGITEQQAELLAGQFGGMRLSLAEQNRIAMQAAQHLQRIEFNTSNAVIELAKHTRFWNDVTVGAKFVHVK